MRESQRPTLIGVVLAGGAGRRLGGDKAARLLAGRPLISYPLAALTAACERVAVVAKADTRLPRLDAERWNEPPHPRHPLTGIVYALQRAERALLVCAADMPFVTADACRTLIAAHGGGDATLAEAGGRIQPVFGVYSPSAAARLRAAAPDVSLRAMLARLDVVRVRLPPDVVESVDTPAALAAAERRLQASRHV